MILHKTRLSGDHILSDSPPASLRVLHRFRLPYNAKLSILYYPLFVGSQKGDRKIVKISTKIEHLRACIKANWDTHDQKPNLAGMKKSVGGNFVELIEQVLRVDLACTIRCGDIFQCAHRALLVAEEQKRIDQIPFGQLLSLGCRFECRCL